jgi:F-type H+-transporting ATPase subunit gamma
MPEYLASVFYDRLVGSQLSEQASRRTAMDNANDNADALLDKLQIEYNKARQNAITQEITEVVSGANVDNQ